MNSELATRHQPPVTHSDEVLVRVEGVSKKFCRSLKKSLWYGVCDIGAEMNPFRRRVAGLSVNGEALLGEADSQPQITSNTPGHPPGGITNNSSALRPGEFWAVNDVSFELRRGEPGGEVAARRIGEANPKGETSWQRANQCLGLIGHNGAGTQAARVAARKTAAGCPQGAMSGSEQVNTTLLKMLNGLIKPDSWIQAAVCDAARKTAEGSPKGETPRERINITMRGRVGALIALGAGFNPILTGETVSPQTCGACTGLGTRVIL